MTTSQTSHAGGPTLPKTNLLPFWLLIAFLTLFGVFVLPMAFPPTMATRSTSYAIGFSNRVAALDLIVLSALVTVYLYWKNRGAPVLQASRTGRMPLRWLGIGTLISLVFTLTLGHFAVRADIYYGDIGYWQTQILQWIHFHGKLYHDFEFIYGPILFYWPAWFEKIAIHFHLLPETGFIAALALMQATGIALTFYLLQELPLSRTLRAIAFVTLIFGTMTPMLGMNYTIFRFTIGYAALLWITKQPSLRLQCLLSFLSAITLFSISADIGFSFTGGVIAYALYRGIFFTRSWLALIPAPAAGFGLFLLLVDRNYFYTTSNFARGLYTTIVEPMPYVFALLIMAVVLAPLAVAGYVRRHAFEAAPIIGLYVASLAMLLSALGYCEALHIFCSSIGLALLSLIGINELRGRWKALCLAIILIPPVWSEVGLTLGLSDMLKRVVVQGANNNGFDLPTLLAITAGQRVYLPFMAPQYVFRALADDGQLQPSYFSFLTNAQTTNGELRKIGEMHAATYVLLPTYDIDEYTWYVENRRRFRLFRLGYTYKEIHPYFHPGALLYADVLQNYVPVEQFGTAVHEQYMLYRKK